MAKKWVAQFTETYHMNKVTQYMHAMMCPVSATAWCLVVAIYSARTRKIRRQIDKDAFQVSITMQIQAYAIKIFLYILP